MACGGNKEGAEWDVGISLGACYYICIYELNVII